ncbi:LOW QUALITY PROTEIN: DBIRD complex subunit ZNF326 [Brachyhypopomus gauderio]|uniref:LOW QUALITY PROTEIN: DBIRD complex subunit ZNF326 n=1 Tax=Brachyhypopomus gauderio TaxID=698409 RepID=UPI00404337C6
MTSGNSRGRFSEYAPRSFEESYSLFEKSIGFADGDQSLSASENAGRRYIQCSSQQQCGLFPLRSCDPFGVFESKSSNRCVAYESLNYVGTSHDRVDGGYHEFDGGYEDPHPAPWTGDTPCFLSSRRSRSPFSEGSRSPYSLSDLSDLSASSVSSYTRPAPIGSRSSGAEAYVQCLYGGRGADTALSCKSRSRGICRLRGVAATRTLHSGVAVPGFRGTKRKMKTPGSQGKFVKKLRIVMAAPQTAGPDDTAEEWSQCSGLNEVRVQSYCYANAMRMSKPNGTLHITWKETHDWCEPLGQNKSNWLHVCLKVGHISSDSRDLDREDESKVRVKEKRRRRREKNREKYGDKHRMAFTCAFCKFRTFEDKDIEKHFGSMYHRETLDYIRRQTKFDDRVISFLHDCMVQKFRKTVSALCKLRTLSDQKTDQKTNQKLMEGVTEDDYMRKVEVVHCVACDTHIPAVFASVQHHLNSPVHLKSKVMYKEQLKRESVLTAKAIINNDSVKVRYEKYMKGEDPFVTDSREETSSDSSEPERPDEPEDEQEESSD